MSTLLTSVVTFRKKEKDKEHFNIGSEAGNKTKTNFKKHSNKRKKQDKLYLSTIFLGIIAAILTSVTLRKHHSHDGEAHIMQMNKQSIKYMNKLPHAEKLSEIKAASNRMKNIEDTISNFCSDCHIAITTGGIKTRISCKERLDFIVHKYNDQEDDVKESLKTMYPQCKKHTNIEDISIHDDKNEYDDISNFCHTCPIKMTVSGINYKITCVEQLMYMVDLYNYDSANDLVKGFMMQHPQCIKNLKQNMKALH